MRSIDDQHTSIEDEAIDSDLLIPGHANLVKEILAAAQRADRSHEPAITDASLAHIFRI